MSKASDEKELSSELSEINTVNLQNAAPNDRLNALPQKYRDEILKQYDLPQVKVNLFTILGCGTSTDFVLQIFGSVMSVGAGSHSVLYL